MEFLQLVPWWVWIIVACVVVSVITALAKLFKSFADVLKLGLTLLISILKVLWMIVTAPFKLIGWIIRRRREAKGK